MKTYKDIYLSMAAIVVAYSAMSFFSLMWYPHEEVGKHFGLLIIVGAVGIGFLLNPAVPNNNSASLMKTLSLGLIGAVTAFEDTAALGLHISHAAATHIAGIIEQFAGRP